MSMSMFSQPGRRGRPKKYVHPDDHREIERRYMRAMDRTIQEFVHEKAEERSREAALRQEIKDANRQ